MSDAWTGFLILFGALHVILIAVPLTATLKSPISAASKLVWSLFLLLLPLIGVGWFHYYFRTSLFRGKGWEISPEDERARSGTLAPRDDDR